jgi:hypothetical protein
MYYRMAQVTFTMPVVTPNTAPPPAPTGFQFSWDMFFTFALLLCVCCCFGWWVSFIMGATQTNPNQCTPDGQPSTGVYGSDCCSTNGIDGNGNCQPSGPMGVPPYGIQNSSTPQEYQFNAVPAPGPAAIPTPPVPNVSTSSPAPVGYPPAIWNDNGT